MCQGQKDFQNFLGVRVGRQKSLKSLYFNVSPNTELLIIINCEPKLLPM